MSHDAPDTSRAHPITRPPIATGCVTESSYPRNGVVNFRAARRASVVIIASCVLISTRSSASVTRPRTRPGRAVRSVSDGFISSDMCSKRHKNNDKSVVRHDVYSAPRGPRGSSRGEDDKTGRVSDSVRPETVYRGRVDEQILKPFLPFPAVIYDT